MFRYKQIGINGKFLNMFKAMYDETKAAVRINDKITNWFHTKAGVGHGQNDSPTAFSILIKNLPFIPICLGQIFKKFSIYKIFEKSTKQQKVCFFSCNLDPTIDDKVNMCSK